MGKLQPAGASSLPRPLPARARPRAETVLCLAMSVLAAQHSVLKRPALCRVRCAMVHMPRVRDGHGHALPPPTVHAAGLQAGDGQPGLPHLTTREPVRPVAPATNTCTPQCVSGITESRLPRDAVCLWPQITWHRGCAVAELAATSGVARRALSRLHACHHQFAPPCPHNEQCDRIPQAWVLV